MSPTSFESPNRERTVKEKEQEMSRRLGILQLQYAEKVCREDAGQSFLQALMEKTSIGDHVRDISMQLHDRDVSDEEIERQASAVREKIVALFEKHQDGWEDAIMDEIDSAEKEWRGPKRETREKERIRSGAFNADVHQNAHLEAFGIPPEAEILELHVEELFKVGGELNIREMKDHLSHIAHDVVENYPAVKAVVGKSWLIDHPIAKRIGFQVLENVVVPQNGMNIWLQFVKKDGTINEQRAKQLMQTGKFPFQCRSGFLPIEDFFKRYLPAEDRGKEIALQEVNPEWSAWRKKISEEGGRFQQAYPAMGLEDISHAMDAYPTTKAYFEEIGIAKQFVELLQRAKAEGRSFRALHDFPEFKELDDVVGKNVNRNKYRPSKTIVVM